MDFGSGTGFGGSNIYGNIGAALTPPSPTAAKGGAPVMGAKLPPQVMNTPGQTFQSPQSAGSGWTGVSSNADPYGIHGIGYDISKVPLQPGDMSGGLSRDELLGAGGFQAGERVAGSGNESNTSYMVTSANELPDALKFSGYTKYENQNAADGSALGSDAAQIQAQTTNAQNNMNNMASGYPAYGNQYGLGGKLTPQASGANPAQPPSQGVTVNVADTSSRGFNPWSIMGESNARTGGMGV